MDKKHAPSKRETLNQCWLNDSWSTTNINPLTAGHDYIRLKKTIIAN